MEVFVTGAIGVLGRASVRRLLEAGHTVQALSRTVQNDAPLRRLGATPAPADLFSRASLERALAGCEAVLHLATGIPQRAKHAATSPAGLKSSAAKGPPNAALIQLRPMEGIA